jgi:hypothetical protein
VPFSIFDEHKLRTFWSDLNPGNTPGSIGVVSPFGFGTRVDSLFICNSDVIDHIAYVSYGSAGDDGRVGSVNVPARSGFDGAGPIDLLAAVTSVNFLALIVAIGDTIYVGCDDTLGGGVEMAITGTGGDF